MGHLDGLEGGRDGGADCFFPQTFGPLLVVPDAIQVAPTGQYRSAR